MISLMAYGVWFETKMTESFCILLEIGWTVNFETAKWSPSNLSQTYVNFKTWLYYCAVWIAVTKCWLMHSFVQFRCLNRTFCKEKEYTCEHGVKVNQWSIFTLAQSHNWMLNRLEFWVSSSSNPMGKCWARAKCFRHHIDANRLGTAVQTRLWASNRLKR